MPLIGVPEAVVTVPLAIEPASSSMSFPVTTSIAPTVTSSAVSKYAPSPSQANPTCPNVMLLSMSARTVYVPAARAAKV